MIKSKFGSCKQREVSWQHGHFARTIEYLRSIGHDAKRLLEEDLERLPDEEIIEKARNENSIILTNDLGFGNLLAASRAELPSVIIFRLEDMRGENVNLYLTRVIDDILPYWNKA